MREQLLNFWELLRGSLWFIPALMTGVSIGLAFLLLAVDAGIGPLERAHYLWQGGTDGAREMLSTIATSIITVAGVAFSVTVVALSLAASQYGALVLVNYRRDRINQVVLGVFISTFVYCLVILGNISDVEGAGPVPTLSVSVSLLLALISLAAFILFIHRMTRAMQSDYLTASVGTELLGAINWIFPEEMGGDPAEQRKEPDGSLPARFEAEAWPIAAPNLGYLQVVESARLMAFVVAEDLVLRVNVRPGNFITQTTPLALAWSEREQDRDRIGDALQKFFHIGDERTPSQDPEFAVLQLTQIAVRALSPGINDPLTAMMCIDWLAAALHRLTCRRIPSEQRFDAEGKLRIMAPVAGFDVTADAAFDTLRSHGRTEPQILMRLVQAAGEIGENTRRPADRDTLLRHVEQLYREGMESLSMPWEREKLADACDHTKAILAR